ncbi:hypothetical protein [Pseudolactococcus carnosus]|uniref:Uncharacterized protein n=1 Tax=Pseudolactococcus carnosus TaxID=2749961 RepID=A0ABT0AVD2_9LACT|nr:hypothetical protein [Lactococcus carnosus]MCJ1990530.1 hypothetical protein [Lactococcus carnosus]
MKNELAFIMKFNAVKWLSRILIGLFVFIVFFSPDSLVFLLMRTVAVMCGLSILKLLKIWGLWLLKRTKRVPIEALED